jgi:hypothetical protein
VTSLPPLVAVEDVTDRLPSSVTVEEVRVRALISDASAAVRRFTKQSFTVATSTLRIRPIGNRIRLPKKPVLSVTSVGFIIANNAVAVNFPGWYWDGSDEIWLMTGGTIVNLAEELTFALEWQTPVAEVVWTHGYTQVPDDVVGVICSMVTRLITAPGLGGVISESVGEYSYRLSDTAAQGPMALTTAEKDILHGYRPRNTATIELRG